MCQVASLLPALSILNTIIRLQALWISYHIIRVPIDSQLELKSNSSRMYKLSHLFSSIVMSIGGSIDKVSFK